MRQGEPVLVVDDDRDLRRALARMLKAEGHIVLEAEHGRDALDILAAAQPHLIILDLSMPVMDGRAFLEHKAKTEFADIPVVVFSASNPDGVETMPGVVSVVHKLAGVNALLDAVKQATATAPRPHRKATATQIYLTLQGQLLRLGVMRPASEEACSTCAHQVPLFNDVLPGQCLRCRGRASGLWFPE